MTVTDRARGAFELTRPSNSIAAGVSTFVGTVVAGDPFSVSAVAAVVATIVGTGAGMGVNDYFDRDIDAINRPDRPIPRGTISPRWAILQSTVLFAVAVALALTLPLLAIAIAIINLVALVSYTKIFKGLPGLGNALVAVLGGSTFLFGGAAVGNPRETVVLFVLAACATFGREIIKDVEDMRGDRAEGVQTLPIAIGRGPASVIAAASLVVAVLASPLPYIRGTFALPYLIVLMPAIGVMLLGLVASWREPGRGQRFVKYGMYVAIGAFVVGRIAVTV